MPRILVADDNSNIQKMVSLAFQDHGIEVIAVGNGEAAVRRIPDINPDVVLADVFMPVRNGYEVCEFIKKDPRFSKVPVILLVGAFDPLDEAEARRVGADGILKKPFVPPDPLIAMVTSVMAKAPKPDLKAEAPVLEIPKPPPPPVIPQFPDPTPEEEAYAFGTGRRSLDEDDAAAGAGHAAQVAVTPATASSTETMASAEDDAGVSETSVDWRRREQVNSAEVPSFSAALIDEPTGQGAPESDVEANALAADTAPDSPVLTEEPNPEPASSESFMRAFAGAFGEPPTVADVEEPAEAMGPHWHKPLEESFRSTKGLTDLMAPALANPSDWNLNDRAEAGPVEAAPVDLAPAESAHAPAVENVSPEVQSAPPLDEPAASGAAPEFSAPDAEPAPGLAVETPEPESFSFSPAAAESAAQSALEAIPFPPEHVSVETLPQRAGDAVVEASTVEAPAIDASATPAAEFESIARIEEAEETEPLAAPVAFLESTEVVAREIGRIPVADAPDAHPSQPEPETAPVAAVAEVEAAPPRSEPIAEQAVPPELSHVSAQPDSQTLPDEAAPEPTASSAATTETVASPPTASAPPSVDELVAKVLEKLGPQLQELLSKNLVRPMVEDLLHKPENDKK